MSDRPLTDVLGDAVVELSLSVAHIRRELHALEDRMQIGHGERALRQRLYRVTALIMEIDWWKNAVE